MIDNSEIKVKSLQKALEILNLFADKPVLGVTEISEYFGIYKSTVHNILSTLKAMEYLEQDEETGKYIIIEKTGSSTQDFITTASIVIKSYADSKYEVAQLNEKIKDVMLYQFIENDDISSVKLVTDYPYPDTAIKKERYQALFEIVY